MSRKTLIQKFERLLASADVTLGGSRPWDIQVHDQDFYRSVLAGGALALGQAYMAGWWDCDKLDEFFHKILRTRLDVAVKSRTWFITALKARLFNRQKPSRAFQVGRQHYDIDNALYRRMLDKRMIYSCAYWESASTLDEAQEHKLELICRKLKLAPGMRVLDIGCGWGGTARFIAERYRVDVVGITVSEKQVRFGNALCRGLPVDIRLQDYRTLCEKFDRILSIGMFEHVGYKNYARFMRIVRACLKDDGRFVLQTIARNKTDTTPDPWIACYIFPNSLLPSAMQICRAMEDVFVIEDWHSFGPDYDKTLMQWFLNFNENWNELKDRYDERFYRMWKYYLLSSAGSFRARRNQLWQIVISP